MRNIRYEMVSAQLTHTAVDMLMQRYNSHNNSEVSAELCSIQETATATISAGGWPNSPDSGHVSPGSGGNASPAGSNGPVSPVSGGSSNPSSPQNFQESSLSNQGIVC